MGQCPKQTGDLVSLLCQGVMKEASVEHLKIKYFRVCVSERGVGGYEVDMFITQCFAKIYHTRSLFLI